MRLIPANSPRSAPDWSADVAGRVRRAFLNLQQQMVEGLREGGVEGGARWLRDEGGVEGGARWRG